MFDLIHINEIFYHQTNEGNAKNILQTGFNGDIHDGQARFTHGVYFLKHSKANYGDVTISAHVDGNFINLINDDIFADKWKELKNSVQWNNESELSIKLRTAYPNADGIIF